MMGVLTPQNLEHYKSSSPLTSTLLVNYGCLFLFSCSVVSNSLRSHGLQDARLPCPSLSPRVCSNSCPLSHLIPNLKSLPAHYPRQAPCGGDLFPGDRGVEISHQTFSLRMSRLLSCIYYHLSEDTEEGANSSAS